MGWWDYPVQEIWGSMSALGHSLPQWGRDSAARVGGDKGLSPMPGQPWGAPLIGGHRLKCRFLGITPGMPTQESPVSWRMLSRPCGPALACLTP